jgi:hypothetical protein
MTIHGLEKEFGIKGDAPVFPSAATFISGLVLS